MSNHRIILLLGAIAALNAGAAESESREPVVRTISASTGSFTTNDTWNQYWQSTEASPRVYLAAGRKDMNVSSNGIGLDLREGTAHSSTYTISTDGAWRVSGFAITFRGNSAANPVTLTSGATSVVSKADEDCHVSITGIGENESATFTLTGNNQGISTTDFTVTLEPIVPDEYVEATVDMTTGELATGGTAWRSLWSGAADEHGMRVYIATTNASGATARNLSADEEGNSLIIRCGTGKTCHVIPSAAGSWRISGFSLSFLSSDADNPATVTAGTTSLTSSPTAVQTLEVKDLAYGSMTEFTVQAASATAGIIATDFKVHLSPCTPTRHGVSVFTYTGKPPYSTVYRIPTLAYIPAGNHKGRIVAVNDFRPCGSDIGYGEVDLHTSISDDLGEHWTLPADPVDAEGNHVADGDGKGTPATSNENRDCGFGDPAIVADRETGDLLMLGVCGRVPIGSATRRIPQGLATWTSHDGGQTWTQWKDITEDILTQLDNNCQYGAADGLFFTAGRMVQSRYVKVGSHYRVYAVAGGRIASIPDTQCWVFYTDDFGQNWHILGDPYNPALSTGGSEPKCEELPDGSILYSGRTPGGRNFNIFTYTDYASATGHWADAQFGRMVTGAAGCNGDAMIVPVKNNVTGAMAYMLMQSIPQHPSSRVNVGINYKILDSGYDDFGTVAAIASDWDGAYQVSNTGSAYSSLTLLADGSLGFIYEESTYGRDYTEIYRRLTVDEITHGAYSYAPDSDLSAALALTLDVVNGKTAAANKDYASRTELLADLNSAAETFRSQPSTENYLAFNRALRAVETNTPQSSIDEITADEAPASFYDLTGRKAAKLMPGRLYISSKGEKIIR